MFDFQDFTTVFNLVYPDFETEIANDPQLEWILDEESDQVAGYCGWKVTIEKQGDGDDAYIVPKLSWPNPSSFRLLNVRILMNPQNYKNPDNEKFMYSERFYYKIDEFIAGIPMKLSEILDRRNGWLNEDNGAFGIKIGFYIESMQDVRGLWRFNFLNCPFDWKYKSALVHFFEKKGILQVACHVQMLKIHCTKLAEILTPDNKIMGIPFFHQMKVCLNILHGVQLKYTGTYFEVLHIAQLLGLSNVIRYLELQFIEGPPPFDDIRRMILFAVRSNLKRLLIRSLRELDDLSVLKEALKKVNIGRMSGESMKICVMKLLHNTE